MVVVAEEECNGYRSGCHRRGAVFDHSLQVPSFCTVNGMIGMLPYRTAPVGEFRCNCTCSAWDGPEEGSEEPTANIQNKGEVFSGPGGVFPTL